MEIDPSKFQSIVDMLESAGFREKDGGFVSGDTRFEPEDFLKHTPASFWEKHKANIKKAEIENNEDIDGIYGAVFYRAG